MVISSANALCVISHTHRNKFGQSHTTLSAKYCKDSLWPVRNNICIDYRVLIAAQEAFSWKYEIWGLIMIWHDLAFALLLGQGAREWIRGLSMATSMDKKPCARNAEYQSTRAELRLPSNAGTFHFDLTLFYRGQVFVSQSFARRTPILTITKPTRFLKHTLFIILNDNYLEFPAWSHREILW